MWFRFAFECPADVFAPNTFQTAPNHKSGIHQLRSCWKPNFLTVTRKKKKYAAADRYLWGRFFSGAAPRSRQSTDKQGMDCQHPQLLCFMHAHMTCQGLIIIKYKKISSFDNYHLPGRLPFLYFPAVTTSFF